MTIDCTLDSFLSPGFASYTPDFGGKKPNGQSLTSREAANNIAMPFKRERPFSVTETSSTTAIQANSVFEMKTSGITLTLGNASFKGCTARVINSSNGDVTLNYGSNKVIKAGKSIFLEFVNNWKVLLADKDETAIVPVSIVVNSLPDKTAYTVNESFSSTGLVIMAIYSDLSQQVVSKENPAGTGQNGYIITSPTMSTVGQKTVTVSYQGMVTTFNISVSQTVQPKTITKIELTTLPTKTVYQKNENLDLSGMVVKVVYSDGSKVVLPYDATGVNGYKCSSPDMVTGGSLTVTVSHTPQNSIIYSQIFKIMVYGEEWDGAVDNVTETNNSLLNSLGVFTLQQAWEVLHHRINADALANYHGLGLGDYMDITAGLPAPASINWNSSYVNLRIYIVGFNLFKGSNGNTKNHIVWGWKNIPVQGQMNSSDVNAGGYPSSAAKTFIDQTLLPSLISALGADYLYNVNRSVSTKGNSTTMQAKLWLPNEMEVFGSKTYGDDPTPQISIPLYTKDANHRIKNYNGSACYWWEGSPYAGNSHYFCIVDNNGYASNHNASGSNGFAPCFCQI